MRHRWMVWSLIGLVVGVGSGTIGPALAADEPNIWYEVWAPALAAAQQAGKPIYVYIYEHHRVPSGRGARRDPCEKMGRTTLIDRDVKQMMRSYVLCALDVRNPAHHEFIRQHKPNLLPDAEQAPQNATLYRLPVHLFFDSGGRKAFELHGYIAPPTFVDILDTVKLLIAAQNSPDGELRQARPYARLGRLCLELGLYEEGKENLNRAIELDPENTAGARADAELDLTIMSIPDDAEQAYRDLASYLTTYPDSERRVEVRYFMAAAKLAAEETRAAIRILEDIAKIPKPVSEEEERWISRAVLMLFECQAAERNPPGNGRTRADAELDRAIDAVSTDPAQAQRDLQSYLNRYPHSKRRVQASYFVAVAKYAAGDEPGAIRVLEDIAKIKHPATRREQRWINTAIELLKALRKPQE